MKHLASKLAFSLLFLFLVLSCKKSGLKEAYKDSKSGSEFKGKGGVFYLGSADVAIPASVYTLNSISGVVVRFKWGSIEASKDQFDWSFIDREIEKAKAAKKYVSLQPLSTPEWLANEGAQLYFFNDENINHATYGKPVSDYLSWDPVYLSRLQAFLKAMAAKYAHDTTIAYINAIGGHLSRNLPDTVLADTVSKIKKTFWTTYAYQADSLAAKMNKMTDYYMQLFPYTPLWCSVDYVRFENKASGRAANYLAQQYTDYGIKNYPDRFGLFREDISGCNPQPSIQSGSHWYILQQHPERTGAQMLWNVQDGPSRMNKCSIQPNSKNAVLDSAVNKGLQLGMRYLEIYSSDITDESLQQNISRYNGLLKAKAQ